jgi:predicted outer membrane repeat protein
VEALEAREVPANFVVNTSLDPAVAPPGDLSLRHAITAANNAGAGVHVITFDMTQVGSVISLGSALPGITKDIWIVGPGQSALTVQRDPTDPASGIFYVFTEGTAVISGLTIRNGWDPRGGAISSWGKSLTVTGCDIRENHATGDGGGVAATKGILEIYDSNINGNSAEGLGGGIYVGQGVTQFRIQDSVVGLNYAESEGGGIYIREVASAVVEDVSVVGNTAAHAGGGIACSGTITLSGTTQISNNRLTNMAAGTGGGVYVSSGTINLLGITIGFNQAMFGDGMYLVTGVTRNPVAGGVNYQGGDTEMAGP